MVNKELLNSKKRPIKLLMIWSYPFLRLWYWLKMLFTPIMLRPGIHVITGDTGGGKTISADDLSRFFIKNHLVVSNSRFNNVVKQIDLDDYFGDFKIKKPLENCVVILDEIQRDFNKRMNRKNEYNAIFIPLIEWLTTHRHNGVYWVYFLTQSWEQLDVQLQRLIQRVHFVSCKKSGSLPVWLRDKSFKPMIIPKKVHYWSKRRSELTQSDINKYIHKVKKGELKYKKTPRRTIKVKLENLATFNTYAFKRMKTADPTESKKKEAIHIEEKT